MIKGLAMPSPYVELYASQLFVDLVLEAKNGTNRSHINRVII